MQKYVCLKTRIASTNQSGSYIKDCLLSNSSPSSTAQSKSDKELTLFSPCHNNNNKNNNKKKKKNPHQNLPERSVLQTWNLEHRLNSQNQDLTHPPCDGHPSRTISRLLTHHPKDSHQSNSTRSSTLAQPSLLELFSCLMHFWYLHSLH